MRVIRVSEKWNAGDAFTLWPIGDFHLGALDCAEDLLREHVQAIHEDPYARWICMGDFGDLIDYRDRKRFHPHPLPERYAEAMFNNDGGIPTETVNHAAEILEPIVSKCWGLIGGNHERSIEKHFQRNLLSELGRALNLSHRVVGYGGFIKVEFHRASSKAKGPENSVVIDCFHGWQSGRRPGAKFNQLELELSHSDADIILRGHSHDRLAMQIPSLKVSDKYVREWPRVIAHTGTYKRGHVETTTTKEPVDTWEETRGFRRKIDSLLGPPRIVMRPREADYKSPEGASKSLVQYTIMY